MVMMNGGHNMEKSNLHRKANPLGDPESDLAYGKLHRACRHIESTVSDLYALEIIRNAMIEIGRSRKN